MLDHHIDAHRAIFIEKTGRRRPGYGADRSDKFGIQFGNSRRAPQLNRLEPTIRGEDQADDREKRRPAQA